jgi:hypothetical protein
MIANLAWNNANNMNGIVQSDINIDILKHKISVGSPINPPIVEPNESKSYYYP